MDEMRGWMRTVRVMPRTRVMARGMVGGARSV